jgi:chromosome segregation ATPase
MESLQARWEQLKADHAETERRAAKALSDLEAGRKIYKELQAGRTELADELEAARGEIIELRDENEQLLREVNDLMALNSDYLREQVERKEQHDQARSEWEMEQARLEAEVKKLRIDMETGKQCARTQLERVLSSTLSRTLGRTLSGTRSGTRSGTLGRIRNNVMFV